MGTPRTRVAARTTAVVYVGLVAATGFVHALRGAPDGPTRVVLQCLTLPGYAVVLLLLLAAAAATGAGGADTGADVAPNVYGPMLVLTAAALVNVLALRGLCAFARRVRAEIRETREWRAARAGRVSRRGDGRA
ncbi:hypothetical protein [Streptomyces marianii]|uniref:Transmembrane protein n=1 Tax=Streptomyces marianii TaxID=1817406 RepID=A0A5R9E0Y3_9ACTN|nr:hypothetical protein [Streptomyces marianii]TLQ42695.1 hypothetical protein FEF34_05480 [Streptomyces marianii]